MVPTTDVPISITEALLYIAAAATAAESICCCIPIQQYQYAKYEVLRVSYGYYCCDTAAICCFSAVDTA